MTVFLRYGSPEEGSKELGKEERGDEETSGKADVGTFGKLIKAFDHEDKKGGRDVGGEKFAEEGDGEDDHRYLRKWGGIGVARLLQRARYQRPFFWSGRGRILVCEGTMFG